MILADLSKFRFSAARFSNSVDKWVTLPDLEGSLESVESYKVTDFIIVVLRSKKEGKLVQHELVDYS